MLYNGAASGICTLDPLKHAYVFSPPFLLQSTPTMTTMINVHHTSITPQATTIPKRSNNCLDNHPTSPNHPTEAKRRKRNAPLPQPDKVHRLTPYQITITIDGSPKSLNWDPADLRLLGYHFDHQLHGYYHIHKLTQSLRKRVSFLSHLRHNWGPSREKMSFLFKRFCRPTTERSPDLINFYSEP